MRRLLAVAATLAAFSGCSDSLHYRTEQGRCIKQEIHRMFAVRVASYESPCRSERDE